MRSTITGVLTAAAVLAVTSVAGCSSGNDATRAATTATSGGRSTTSDPFAVSHSRICPGDAEGHSDDPDAGKGLLRTSELPGFSMSDPATCPWALSGDELLATPSCIDAATNAGAPPDGNVRNGNSHLDWSRSDGVTMDHRVEIYTSRRNVDSIRAILGGQSFANCYADALRGRSSTSGVRASRIVVAGHPLDVTANDLGLGFPAVAGYAADTGFVRAIDITFTTGSASAARHVATRVVTYGAGGLMSTLTLIGPSTKTLDGVDITALVTQAAADFRVMTGPG